MEHGVVVGVEERYEESEEGNEDARAPIMLYWLLLVTGVAATVVEEEGAIDCMICWSKFGSIWDAPPESI